MTESILISRHIPCTLPNCGSSDGMDLYNDHVYCFACEQTARTEEGSQAQTAGPFKSSGRKGGLLKVEPVALAKRKLHEKTCAKWGYGLAEYRGQTVQVASYRDDTGKVVAQKVRTADKKFVILGDAKKMGLYGKWLWRDGGRKIIVVEGEIDALTMSQLQELKWPVVSVPNGAKSAAKVLAAEAEWLSSYKEVILMFDADEAGQDAAVKCAAVLPPGKVKIAVLPEGINDPSDGLQQGRGRELINCMFEAKVYRPDGIVDSSGMREILKERKGLRVIGTVPYPDLQDKTRGLLWGQVWMICSGSGMGKTEFTREFAYSFIQQGLKLGYVALEEGVDRTALGLVGLHMGKRMHLEEDPESLAGFDEAWDAVLTDKVFCYDHFGSMEGDNLISKMRYMRVALGVDVIILDHLSIVVSGMEDDDERKTIDRIMTKLKSLAQETGVGIICVSHLKRPKGTPHEEGGRTSLAQLRGSASIGQLSNISVGLERDQQDSERGDITTIRILKNRETGVTGLAGEAIYDHETGRMLPHEEDLFPETGERVSAAHTTTQEESDF